jgi:hypothetical protein
MPVPVRIGLSTQAAGDQPVFVVGIADAVQPRFYETLKVAEKSYRDEARGWHAILETIKSNKSDALPRLELGRRIDKIFAQMTSTYGIQIVNEEAALTAQLKFSKSTVYYIRHASRRFTSDDVTQNRLNWMQVQVLSDIRDRSRTREGLKLAREGHLSSQDELREFRRAANSTSAVRRTVA